MADDKEKKKQQEEKEQAKAKAAKAAAASAAKGGTEKKAAPGKKGKKDEGAHIERGEQEKAGPPRLMVRYQKETLPALMKDFGWKNPMQAPKLQKIVVNMGLGEALTNGKIIDAAQEQLMAITGQKPVVTKSRKSIANFKLRQGQSIGCMVTLRKAHMWEFFDRLVNIALPRVRDFKGLNAKSFDGKGNYTLGLREQIIFPEIEYDKIEKIKGLNITIVTSARNDEEGRALLRYMGMPFRAA